MSSRFKTLGDFRKATEGMPDDTPLIGIDEYSDFYKTQINFRKVWLERDTGPDDMIDYSNILSEGEWSADEESDYREAVSITLSD